MPISFSGRLEATPDDFKPSFSPLVIHDSYASFRIEAVEPDRDNWSIDDRAPFENGEYKSGLLTMRFDSGVTCRAQITFNADQLADGTCRVEARFEQFEQDDESVWQISGVLLGFGDTSNNAV